MNRYLLYVAVVGVCWGVESAPALHAATNSKPATEKGTSVEDIGRGLKSAARNIEQEIPKIGPAIGAMINRMSGKDSHAKPGGTAGQSGPEKTKEKR